MVSTVKITFPVFLLLCNTGMRYENVPMAQKQFISCDRFWKISKIFNEEIHLIELLCSRMRSFNNYVHEKRYVSGQ